MTSFSSFFSIFAERVAQVSGRPVSFLLCVLLIMAWGVSGPVFAFSDTWQLVINTGTTVITFLMVFLIQSTQNRDGAALHAKLDELIRASAAQNAFIGIEHLTQEELDQIRARCEAKAKLASLADTAGKPVRRKAASAAEKGEILD